MSNVNNMCMKKIILTIVLLLSFAAFIDAQLYYTKQQLLTEFKDYLILVDSNAVQFQKNGITYSCYVSNDTNRCIGMLQSNDAWTNDSAYNYLSNNKNIIKIADGRWVYAWVENGSEYSFQIVITTNRFVSNGVILKYTIHEVRSDPKTFYLTQ